VKSELRYLDGKWASGICCSWKPVLKSADQNLTLHKSSGNYRFNIIKCNQNWAILTGKRSLSLFVAPKFELNPHPYSIEYNKHDTEYSSWSASRSNQLKLNCGPQKHIESEFSLAALGNCAVFPPLKFGLCLCQNLLLPFCGIFFTVLNQQYWVRTCDISKSSWWNQE
jgi:hypothetical protein